MKKYTYIFLMLMAAGSISLGCFEKMSSKNWGDQRVEWEISGDESLIKNVKVDFSVSGGTANDNWHIQTNPYSEDSKSWSYSMGNGEHMTEMMELYKELNYYGDVSWYTGENLDDYCYFREEWINGHGWSDIYSDESAFYLPYIEKAIENKQDRVEIGPISLRQIMGAYNVLLSLKTDYSSIEVPVPEEIMVSPYICFCSANGEMLEDLEYDSYDELMENGSYWKGKIENLKYNFESFKFHLDDEEYVVVSFRNLDDDNDDKCFTDIYRITSDKDRHLLEEPELVKHYDRYQPIRYMFEAKDGAYCELLEHEETYEICRFNIDNFEVVDRFIIEKNSGYYEEDMSNIYEEHGIVSEFESYHTEQFFLYSDLVNFHDDKLYLLSHVEGKLSGALDEERQWIELRVFEPNNTEPLAYAKIKCNLFSLDSSYHVHSLMGT